MLLKELLATGDMFADGVTQGQSKGIQAMDTRTEFLMEILCKNL